jgi:hypothetical protein
MQEVQLFVTLRQVAQGVRQVSHIIKAELMIELIGQMVRQVLLNMYPVWQVRHKVGPPVHVEQGDVQF